MKLVIKSIVFGFLMLTAHLIAWVEFEQDDIGRPGPMWLHQVIEALNYVLRPVESLAYGVLEFVHFSRGGFIEGDIPRMLGLITGALIVVAFWALSAFAIVTIIKKAISTKQ